MTLAKKPVVPEPISTPEPEKAERLRIIAQESTFDEKRYLYDDSFKSGDTSDFRKVHTIPEMLEHLTKVKETEIGGKFLEADTTGRYRYRSIEGRSKFLETWKANSRLKKFREVDVFAGDSYGSTAGANAGLVGDDYVPLLGGPFNKQPYLYDYLRAQAYCFHEYTHHPFARAIIDITANFVLGRGYRVDSDDPRALALWRAFEQVNRLPERVVNMVKEGARDGEVLIWWVPGMQVNVAYQVQPGQQPEIGAIPRIRFIDPSTCWEIVTYPEDIERVLFYWLVFPTQYQIKMGMDGGSMVPTAKFINQQLPASDVMHFKYNCSHNEKRGRSDLFPVLGYLKWVRDCVNYKLIALKKQAAWTEDIEIAGSQADVDAAAQAFQGLGPFEPAGSRYFHTNKIKRTYLANQHGGAGDDPTLEWGINMIAAGSGIPVTYFGLTHVTGQSRAGALVGTEPVAKKFERRQLEVKVIIQALWRRFQDTWGVKGSECNIIFPEIISQDSAQKLKNIKFAEDCEYISHQTAAPMAAKEVDDDEYDYEAEQAQIQKETGMHTQNVIGAPLTAPAAAPSASPGSSAPKPAGATAAGPAMPAMSSPPSPRAPGAVTGNQKHDIAVRKGT